MPSLLKKQTIGLFCLVFVFAVLSGCDRPRQTGMEFGSIDTSREPVQTPCSSDEPMEIEIEGGKFSMTPLAQYHLSGRVVSRETYSSGWAGEISPIDLAIVWGDLAKPESDQYISYSQGNRWYFYRYKEGTPFDNAYIIAHSANHHIIPANENIREAVLDIRKEDRVGLEGYLVNLKGVYQGQTVTWKSSLSREDTGNGSCELFYVTKVRIGTNIYE